MSKKVTLVLFDFDGTLTTRDTLFEFTRFAVGEFRFVIGMIVLAAPLVLNKLKLLSGHRTKEIFIKYFFGGISNDRFEQLCVQWATLKLPGLIRPKAMEAIQTFKSQRARMVIVSASAENWIRPWAIAQGIEVIATKLQVVNSKLTGAILGQNCNNEEKAIRITQEIPLAEYAEVVAYGDTSGDLPMFRLAHQQHFKPFR